VRRTIAAQHYFISESGYRKCRARKPGNFTRLGSIHMDTATLYGGSSIIDFGSAAERGDRGNCEKQGKQ
jgi:hypothetical protein